MSNHLIRQVGWSILLGLGVVIGAIAPGIAHEVEVSGQVGATLHIEPNDTPHAGMSSLVWFALARRGGQRIPLADCNCTLAVYSGTYRQGSRPMQTPTLRAVAAETYQGIPGADVTFPRAGAYELVLRGQSVRSGAFPTFELRFPVTVAQ
jgi:hypothetical protein